MSEVKRVLVSNQADFKSTSELNAPSQSDRNSLYFHPRHPRRRSKYGKAQVRRERGKRVHNTLDRETGVIHSLANGAIASLSAFPAAVAVEAIGMVHGNGR